MRDKNTNPAQIDPEELGEALTNLSDKESLFLELMQTGQYSQRDAYRRAYPDWRGNDRSTDVEACRLWNSPKLSLIRRAMAEATMSRLARTREERIARMERIIETAIASGNYGAAVKAEELSGKLEGHYVDKFEDVAKTQDIESLVDMIRQTMGEEAAKTAAIQMGVEYQETVH